MISISFILKKIFESFANRLQTLRVKSYKGQRVLLGIDFAYNFFVLFLYSHFVFFLFIRFRVEC